MIGGLRVRFGRSPMALMGETRWSCAEAPQVIEVDFTESSEFGVDFEEQSGWTRTGNLGRYLHLIH